MIRTNRRVTIERPAAAPTGLTATSTLQVLHSDVRAWVRFSNAVIITSDGSEASSDGEMRISRAYAVQQNDVLHVLDDTRRFRVEGVDEILSLRGRVVGYRAFLLRDTSLE